MDFCFREAVLAQVLVSHAWRAGGGRAVTDLCRSDKVALHGWVLLNLAVPQGLLLPPGSCWRGEKPFQRGGC